MPYRILASLCLLVVLLTGCGGASSPSPTSTTSSASIPGSATAATGAVDATTLQVTSSGAQGNIQGVGVTFAPGAVSQTTQVVLASVKSPPAQPISTAYRAVGQFVTVDTGSAILQGDVTFTFPQASATSQVSVLVDGFFIPLSGITHSSSGSASGTLTSGPDLHGETFSVGLVEPLTDADPPHVDWGSWNGYVFVPGQGTAIGSFQRVVTQGRVTGSGLPTLGARPLIFVHGLGSSIQSGTFNAAAQYLWNQGLATAIVGFEYDTLDSVATNGGLLRQAFTMFGASSPTPPAWNIVAHSMGTLVTRQAIEQPGPAVAIAGSGNRAVLMCGPHLGSSLINNLQGRNLLGDLLQILNENGYMLFTNADGTRCKVLGTESGINDLRTNSAFLTALNVGAATNHPQVAYFTLAGEKRRTLLQLSADLFNVFLDDGLVDATSAAWNGLGQQLASPVHAFDHLTVNQPSTVFEGDGNTTFPEIARLLTL